MIRSFKNAGTEDLFYGRETKAARKSLPAALRRQASKKLDALDSAAILDDLRIPPGNRLEALRGDRRGSTASGSMSNTGSASAGPILVQRMWKSSTTIEVMRWF